MQIIVGGILIDYFEKGAGSETIVFLHGWQDSKQTFMPLVGELSKTYRCIAIDMPNFGNSETTEKVTKMIDYVHCVSKIIEKMEIKSYILAGHSMGGQISLLGCGDGALKPNKLVIIAGAGVRYHQELKKKLRLLAAKTVKRLIPASAKAKYYRRISSDYDPKMQPLYKKIINSALTTDVQLAAAKISMPTLLIYGDGDKQTPNWMGQTLKSIINDAKYYEVANADHWLHQKHSKEVADQIKEFVQK